MLALAISLLLSVAAYAMSTWLGRKNPARASSLTAGMTLLLLIAPLFIFAPKWQIALPFFDAPEVSTSAALTPETSLTLPLSIWLLGLAFFLSRYIHHIHTLHRWVRKSEMVTSAPMLSELNQASRSTGLRKAPQLRISEEVHYPVVAGLFKPVILLPKKANLWSESTLRMVLLHELKHIHRHDLWIAHTAHINCILYWCNPFVWLLRKHLRHQCEFAVDAQVIANGVDAKCYISALCNVAESLLTTKPAPSAALAMADKASLRNRVHRLLHEKKPSSPLLVISLLSFTACSTFALNIIRPLSEPLDSPNQAAAQPAYSEAEVQRRFDANPFPADH